MKSRKRLFSPSLGLLEALLADAGMACNTSIIRDFQTLKSRVEHEGGSFLTICLPTFAKGFERSLEAGRWLPHLFTGFKTGRKRCLPAFLQGFTSLVFHSTKGDLHENPSIDAVVAIRQICLCYNKIKSDCTEQRQHSAGVAYVSCEAEVAKFRVKDWSLRQKFAEVSRLYYGSVFNTLSCVMQGECGLPTRHGPGVTVDGTSGNRKYLHRGWSRRLNRVFPFDRYWFVNFNELVEELGGEGIPFEEVLPKEEPPVRVCFVPKTQKAPRVIAIEPVYNQYIQQGLMRVLVPLLERDKRTRGQINFSDQSINGALALSSSITKEFATIDLKEASDRLHAAVVHLMVQSQPDVNRAVFACRSKYAKLPNGKVIPMKKFASQGSAVTFPIEAMAFFSIAVASFAKHYDLPAHHPRVRAFSKKVFVYGDDIIVPTKEVSLVVEGLESAGLLVNKNKTFIQSHFRESCGIDAFAGHIVTPIYVRTNEPLSKRDASEIASTVSTANQFYLNGYWKSAAFLREVVEKCVGFEFPHVKFDSELLGWYSFMGHYSVMRWNSHLHSFQTRGLSLRIRKKTDRLSGYRALAKYFNESDRPALNRDIWNTQVFWDSRAQLFDGFDESHVSDGSNFGVYERVEYPNKYASIRFPLDEERFAVTSRRGAVYTKLHWASA